MYRENVHAIHIAMQFAEKSRHCVIKIDSQQQRSNIGALLQNDKQEKERKGVYTKLGWQERQTAKVFAARACIEAEKSLDVGLKVPPDIRR